MIIIRKIYPFSLLIIFLHLYQGVASANDSDQILSGDEVTDFLGTSKSTESSPYVIHSSEGEVENQKIKSNALPDIMFNNHPEEVTVKENAKTKFLDSGYTLPGTLESKDEYSEIDKKAVVDDFRKHSSGSINLTFIKNDFNYESTNDVINKTISEGYKHVKGGALYLRCDQYLNRTSFLNSFWSLGAGVGFNSGRGLFVTGERSETTFRLWEIPLDLGIGLEVPIYHWFKIAGTVGPSVLGLYQNRNDLQSGEKGKNKLQVSYGQFANAQFKVNLTGFNTNAAYSLFSESKITNLYMNFEIRYQNYRNFQDEIKVSGTSFGIGFSFEYL